MAIYGAGNPAFTNLKGYTDLLAKKKAGTGPTAPIPGAPGPGAPNPFAPPSTLYGKVPNPAVPTPTPTQSGITPSILEGMTGAGPEIPKPPDKQVVYYNPPAPATGVTTDTPKQETYTMPTPATGMTVDTPPKQTVTYNPPAPATGVTTDTPPAPTTTTPPAGGKSDQLYDSVLDQLAAGIKDDKPLPGTAAAIAQNREALATYAKSAEARAGMAAAKTGALGQGTANAMGQETRQDVLGELAKSELGNTQLVSNEKQKLIDMATQAGQFGQNKEMDQQRIDVGKDEFKQTIEQRKSEFDKNFGASESTDYRNQLERMAQDNPVLASKLTNYLLDGKTGSLGAFTPEEMTQIKTYAADKKTQDTKLQDVYNKILESVPGQINASNDETADAKKKTEEENKRQDLVKKLASIPAGQYLSEEEFKTLEKNQDISRFSAQTVPRDRDSAQAFLTKTPSGIFSLDGQQYRYIASSTARTGAGTFTNQERHTDYAEVVDSAGKTKYIYDGKVNDNRPKTVSNDISPFGF